MNYRTASRQQLLAEQARLRIAVGKAEQRLGSSRQVNSIGGGSTNRSRGSTRAPHRDVEQLAAQLTQVDAELARRDATSSQTTSEATPTAD